VLSKMFSKLAAAITTAALCATGLMAQAPQKKVKDQAEYDLFEAARKETDWNKKLQFLNQWKEKYSDSDYKEDRQVMIVVAYQNLRQGEQMWGACKDLLAINPKSVPGLFFLTSLTISLNNTSPDRLETGEKAAKGLLSNLDDIFKASTAADDVKKKERLTYETLAIKTLGWIEMSRKNFDKAEEEFSNFLKLNPNSGQVSYWLGSVMLQQKKAEKQIPALYHLARAANYKGEDALPDAGKTQLQGFLERNYVAFHGDKSGLQELIDLALRNPFPPADLTIKSRAQILAEQEEEFRQKEPQKFLWVQIKKGLTDANGPAYWESTLKGSAMPKLKGKVISVSPANRPKEITVAIMSNDTPEIKLRMDKAFVNKAEPGTELEFEAGVAAEFSGDPFLLTVDQDQEKLTGWPEAPKPVSKKGTTKKGAGKKK